MSVVRYPLEEGSEWGSYLASLAELRLTVARNEDDFVFEKHRNGRIVYLLDASAIRLFLDPISAKHHLVGFGTPEDSEHLATAAVMTAEYLFSRTLSGQGMAPAYLSEGHAEEVNLQIAEMRSQLGGDGRQWRTTSPDRPSALRALVRPKKKSQDAALQQELAELLAWNADSSHQEFAYEIRQFTRLLEEDLVRPLHLLPEASDEVLRPDERLVSSWAALLTDAMAQDLDGSQQLMGADAKLHIRRSALAIAQVTMLNSMARFSVRPTRHVLVTSDRAMIHAYARWYYGLAPTERGEFVLRHVQQYSPILNTEQMSGGRIRSEMVQQLGEIVDSLFLYLAGGAADYPGLLAKIAFQDPNRSRDDRFGWTRSLQSGPLRELEAKWSDAWKSANALNSQWMHRHFAKVRGQTGRSHSAEMDQRQTLLESLERSLMDVETFHAKFTASGFLAQPSDSGARQKVDVEPLLFRSGSKALREILSARDLSKLPPAQVRRNNVSEIDRWIMLSGAACIAFRSSEWRAAIRWAQRALFAGRAADSADRLISSQDRHELHYLIAAASKHLLDPLEDPRVRGQLSHSIAFYRTNGDAFGEIRALLERSELTTSAFIRLSPNGGSLHPEALVLFLEGVDSATDAMRLISFDHASRDELWNVLARRLAVQTLCISAMDSWIARTYSMDQDLILRAAEMLKHLPTKASPTAPFEHAMMHYAQWKLGRDGPDINADEDLRRTLDRTWQNAFSELEKVKSSSIANACRRALEKDKYG